jgi:hypothetical protein
MKRCIPLILLCSLAACGRGEELAANAQTPDLETMVETPGDWSALAQAMGRTPADSGLLQQSPIITDLDALLGGRAKDYRLALGDATPLQREGGVLVTIGKSGRAWLVIAPGDHALAAGLKDGDEWQRFETPGAQVPLPPSVKRLTAS